MNTGKNYLVGIFSEEDVVMSGIPKIREAGVKIEEVYTPYPVHGLEHVLGYSKSKLPMIAFFFGLTGTCLALTMQIGMMYFDWPMIIGGKDFLALPDFIPVTFELTVLLTAFGMVGTFFVTRNLKPWAEPKIFDVRSTDDKYVMAIDLDVNNKSADEIRTILNEAGASEVNEKSFE
ncbi:DUF3341 domain-containing protein [Marinigracilibium pacificum]|uniref:DUF3341 domain-containing protein n=1 Tax=Marinigracilibium pacificum TaxID=2729599 RepID=A0A848J3R8_9BACT|nr:DUF3341 domain-containing protein [Marinigracilibium pacificum]NMM50155.1 DUF3341 domain-containing protein [Marinigracilibium pacificum]